jgi:hypothetical protein
MEVRTCTHCTRKAPANELFLKKDGGYYSQCKICRTNSRKQNGTARRRLVETKHNCKRRDIDFALSREEAFSFFESPCTYCSHYDNTYCNGIDRLDAKRGYLPDNCVSCCKMCNLLKQQMDPVSFVEHCKRIALCEYVFPDNIPVCKFPMSNLKDETG